jgi:tRNA (guanine37-N1)-methyltransferase
VISWSELKHWAGWKNICLLFGTGWGLSPQVLKEADAVVEPIEGSGEFNHLSVRAAMAIAIDRVLGR